MTTSTYSTLKLEYEGALAILSLNRPEKRNAISNEMIREIPAALDEAEKSPARVLLLTGEGKAFCAGMDLGDLRNLASLSPEQHLQEAQRMAAMFRRIYFFTKPVIAAVNGAAIAGGTGIATLADFTLAVPEAKFGYTEVRIGFLPAVVSVFLRRQVGAKITRDLLLTGRIFDAAEAKELGLVTRIVPGEELLKAAKELAASLVALSPTSLARTKHLLLQAEREELDRDLAAAIHESASIRQTGDFLEGLSAFLEKREPSWNG